MAGWSSGRAVWRAIEVRIAERYRGAPQVAGYDLRNEVRPAPSSAVGWLAPLIPSWGAGDAYDWRAASER